MPHKHLTDRFTLYERDAWRRLRADTPLTLDADDLERLRGVNESLSLTEVEDIYLPLSRLLNLHINATQNLYNSRFEFIGRAPAKVPFIIGVAGSVSVGKSTFARVLQEILRRWPEHPRVELINTDGFLLPNAELERRGIMDRKGFPESYDGQALLRFLARIKAGQDNVEAPVYSHKKYDIVPGKTNIVRQPDVLIVEGLNVLQANTRVSERNLTFVSDFFDFSIFLHADPADLKTWFIERFEKLRHTRFADPDSYFHQYASMNADEALAFADDIWEGINARNYRENISPTRRRADVILNKIADHSIESVGIRKL